MHETVFINKLLKEAEAHGHVKGVTVEVGDLAQIDASDLENALKSRTKWKIEVKRKSAIVKCRCGYQGRPSIVEKGHDFVIYDCPKCHDIPRILEGDLIKLVQVEVE